MTTTPTAWVLGEGVAGLDAATLLIIPTDTGFSGSAVTVADLSGTEITGHRQGGTGDAVRGSAAWQLFVTGTVADDSTAVTGRVGVWVATSGGSDATSYLIAFSDAPGGGEAAFLPTWPSGLIDVPIDSIDAVLSGLDGRVTTLEGAPPPAPGGGMPSGTEPYDLTASTPAAGFLFLDASAFPSVKLGAFVDLPSLTTDLEIAPPDPTTRDVWALTVNQPDAVPVTVAVDSATVVAMASGWSTFWFVAVDTGSGTYWLPT